MTKRSMFVVTDAHKGSIDIDVDDDIGVNEKGIVVTVHAAVREPNLVRRAASAAGLARTARTVSALAGLLCRPAPLDHQVNRPNGAR